QRDYKWKKEYMDLPTFDLSTTVDATNNQFSSNNELEKGGYGSGYLQTEPRLQSRDFLRTPTKDYRSSKL
ncbi:hypothetical protein S83_001499, partial [Arachis hypogaea]